MTISDEEIRKRIEVARAADTGSWRNGDENVYLVNDNNWKWLAEASRYSDAAHIAASSPDAVIPIYEELLELRHWKEEATRAYLEWTPIGDFLLKTKEFTFQIGDGIAASCVKYVLEMHEELLRLRASFKMNREVDERIRTLDRELEDQEVRWCGCRDKETCNQCDPV